MLIIIIFIPQNSNFTPARLPSPSHHAEEVIRLLHCHCQFASVEVGLYLSINYLRFFECSDLRTYYEPWALLRQEEIVQLTGALLGLSVVDCNLVLEHDHLQVYLFILDVAVSY